MALNDHLIRFVLHSSAHDPCSRTVYRPRSKQLVEYLAHASEPSGEKSSDQEPEKTPESEVEKQREQERFVQTRLREIERFELRYRQRT